jgi:hypothetical protein
LLDCVVLAEAEGWSGADVVRADAEDFFEIAEGLGADADFLGADFFFLGEDADADGLEEGADADCTSAACGKDLDFSM